MKLLIGIPILLRSSKTLKDPQPSTFCKEQTTTSSQQAESTSFHDIRQNPGATNLSALGSSSRVGVPQQLKYMTTTLENGKCFVVKWVLIPFHHL